MVDLDDLERKAELIRTNETPDSNTPALVGGAIKDLVSFSKSSQKTQVAINDIKRVMESLPDSKTVAAQVAMNTQELSEVSQDLSEVKQKQTTVEDIQLAMQSLPDGSAVSAQVALNVGKISNLEKAIFVRGKNLFDRTKVVDGFVDSGNGNLATNASSYPYAKASSKIEVEPGKTYTISGRTDTKGIVGYDANGNKVQIIAGSWALPDYNGTFTIPSNVVAIRFSVLLRSEFTDNVKVQLELGKIATQYEDFVEESTADLIKKIGCDVAENTKVIDGSKAAIEYMGELLKMFSTRTISPNADFSNGKLYATGIFDAWYGFSTEKDLDSDGILNAISFSGPFLADYDNILARVSQKVRNADGEITGLKTIKEFSFAVKMGEKQIDVFNNGILFKKDYVLEIQYGSFGSIAATNAPIKYIQGNATGNPYVRYENQVKKSGSLWEVNVELISLSSDTIKKERKAIKILSVGNSFAEDAFSYVPFILKECCPSIDLTFGILYYGGCSLQLHEQHFDTPNDTSYAYRKIMPGENKWSTKNNGCSIQYALCDEDWDIVVFQQNGAAAGNYNSFQPYLNSLIRKFKSVIRKPVRFGWHLTETSDYNFSESVSRFNSYCAAAEKVLSDTMCDILFPSGTGMQNARTIAALQSLGDGGNMMHNSQHAQEGVPCYALALPNVLVIADLCGYGSCGIYGDTNVPTQSWVTARAIPNMNGNSVGATEENCKLAQMAAVMAYKKPLQISNLTELGVVE